MAKKQNQSNPKRPKSKKNIRTKTKKSSFKTEITYIDGGSTNSKSSKPFSSIQSETIQFWKPVVLRCISLIALIVLCAHSNSFLEKGQSEYAFKIITDPLVWIVGLLASDNIPQFLELWSKYIKKL